MAQTISSPTKEEDDIGARIQKLGLPSKPLIMGKSSATNCVHDGFCFCHVYTTMLDRGPDQPMMPDSPEPESRRSDGRPDHLTKPRHDTTRKTNGRASADTAVNGVPKVAQGKKLPFGEYMKRKNAQATGGPASSSTSPVVERRSEH